MLSFASSVASVYPSACQPVCSESIFETVPDAWLELAVERICFLGVSFDAWLELAVERACGSESNEACCSVEMKPFFRFAPNDAQALSLSCDGGTSRCEI